MQFTTLAMALALSVGAASLAAAQTATNPPSGSMGTNMTANNHGTVNTHAKSHKTIRTGRARVSHKTTEGAQSTDLSQDTGHVQPTTDAQTGGASTTRETTHTVEGMSNGTEDNNASPKLPTKTNNGG